MTTTAAIATATAALTLAEIMAIDNPAPDYTDADHACFNLPDDAEGQRYLEIEVRYDLGGMNYFNYTQKERGYYIAFQVCKGRPGGNVRAWSAFEKDSGYLCVEEVKRKSAKRFDTLRQRMHDNAGRLFDLWKSKDWDAVKTLLRGEGA